VWIAVGGSPQSAARAGLLGLPLAIAIIGGMPERFVTFAQVHREALERAGHAPQPVSINSHAYVAETSQQAAAEFVGPYKAMMDRIGRERGWSPLTREQFDGLRGLRGALMVGSPQEVAEKILFQHEHFGHDRFMAQISVGSLPHAQVLRAIELLGTEVVPLVRKELARSVAPAA
jgi:alkanesulfonate monooxygenase SsuD/methylene tetrahydromethanopterin reductase-like flavin-dependent oxidoreductase (luciferase family)